MTALMIVAESELGYLTGGLGSAKTENCVHQALQRPREPERSKLEHSNKFQTLPLHVTCEDYGRGW